jgi:hypothetical protein
MTKLLNKNNLLFIFFIACFSLPRTVQTFKYTLLFIFLISFFYNIKLRQNYLNYLLFYILIYTIPLLIGIVNNNEIDLIIGTLKSNILYPLLVFTFLQIFDPAIILQILKKSSILSIAIILILSLSTILFALGLFPININEIFYPNETNIRISGGYFHVINSSLSYLIFLIPIAFLPFNKLNFKNPSLYFIIILFVLLLLTGRRILILPFIVIALFHFKRFLVPILLVSVAIILIPSSSIFDKEVYQKRFEDAIFSRGDSQVRADQSNYFMEEIKQKPLLGHGIGSYMKNYLRNDEYKTAYEKSYHYQIYSLGIPISLIIWSFYLFLIIKASKNNIKGTGFLLGIISLLIASNTNPYWLSSFDYCIPLGILMRLGQK